MTYFIFAAMMLLAASAVFSLYRQLQVLQQNSYSLTRYFKWVSGSYVVDLAISAIIYCAMMFLVLNDKDLFGLILAGLFLAARIVLNILTYKKSVKKLVFTARIKRLYITAIIVLGVLLFVGAISFGNATKVVPIGDNYLIDNNLSGEIVRTICILLSSVTPALTIVIWLVTLPIEKAISKWGKSKSEPVFDVGEEVDESITDSQEKIEQQTESSDYTYESMLADYDDSKGAKF